MEKLPKQPLFDEYSILLYNAILLPDQKYGCFRLACLNMYLHWFFYQEKFCFCIKKFLRQWQRKYFSLFQFLWKARYLAKVSFCLSKKSLHLAVLPGISQMESKNWQLRANKKKNPNKPQSKSYHAQTKKVRHKSHKLFSSKPITKDLTESKADVQFSVFNK